MSNLIKLRIPGESFWGEAIGPGKAKVSNVLLDPQYRYGDVVTYDTRTFQVTGVVERAYPYSFILRYPSEEVAQKPGERRESLSDRMISFIRAVEALDSVAEGGIRGLFMVDSKWADLPERAPKPEGFEVHWQINGDHTEQ